MKNVPASYLVTGYRAGPPVVDETEHFIQCPTCRRMLDCRDLGEILEHEETCLAPHCIP